MGRQVGSRRAGVLAFVLSMSVVLVSAQAATVKPAVAVVAGFQKTLLATMKQAHKLGFKGRYRALMPAVRASHDLKFIAQVTVGPYWQRLSATQRSAFVHTFRQLTVATYAAQFNGYSGETFRETAARAIGPGDVLVETVLASHGHKEATLDYLVAPKGNRWKIVNIVANGVSDLALKRAQYTAIIQKKGFPSLLSALQAKVAQLRKPPKARQ